MGFESFLAVEYLCYSELMRLYLSSFRFGDHTDKLHELLKGGTNVALIGNSMDFLQGQARSDSIKQEMERLKDIGFDPTEVDLRDYFDNPEGLRQELEQFDLIWVRGGNAFILAQAFLQSGADKVLKELLNKDILAYGGYSAGVCVLTPSLKGLETVDNPRVIPERYQEREIWEGLSILPYAVAPHYKSDHPESRMVDDAVQYFINNHMLFVALRDGEVIINNNDSFVIHGLINKQS
jgi:dipeptidase E